MPRSWTTLALLLLVGAGTAQAAEPQGARDLAYGEALYHFYQQDYFTAGVHLLAAMERHQLPHRQSDAELVLGGLQLYYGMPDQARKTLEKLLTEKVSPALRDRAWFQLAKLGYQRGDYDSATDALHHVSNHLPPALAGEARELGGLIALAQGKPKLALTRLAPTQKPALAPWNIYIRFDHAIAQLRTGQLNTALAELDKLGTIKVHDEEEATLRDRANLAAGFAALRAGHAAQARPYFQRIRLHGPSAHMALLGAGWAAAGVKAYAQAITPWAALAAEPPHDDAVLEGLLALPWGYAQLNDQVNAAKYYEQAITRYRAERKRLAAVRREVEAGALPATLEAQERPGMTSRLRGVDVPLDSPVTSYLPALLAGNRFQEALKNYLDLRQLQDNLDQWSDSLSAFDTMLDARRARFAQVLPRIDARLATINLKSIEQRRAALDTQLATIKETQNVWGVATPHERSLRQWMQQLSQRVAALPDSPQKHAYESRLKRLQGVLYWQAYEAFPLRLWDNTKKVRALDAPLAELKKHLATLENAHHFADSRIKGLGARIAHQRQRIAVLRPRVEHALAAEADRLDRLALTALSERDNMLDSYLLQAQFALARVYDSAQSKEAKQ